MINRSLPMGTPVVVTCATADYGRIGRLVRWPENWQHATVSFGAEHVTFRPEDLRELGDFNRVATTASAIARNLRLSPANMDVMKRALGPAPWIMDGDKLARVLDTARAEALAMAEAPPKAAPEPIRLRKWDYADMDQIQVTLTRAPTGPEEEAQVSAAVHALVRALQGEAPAAPAILNAADAHRLIRFMAHFCENCTTDKGFSERVEGKEAEILAAFQKTGDLSGHLVRDAWETAAAIQEGRL